MVTHTTLEYLDLDGDGVPDAVRTIDTRAAWSNRAGDFEVVQTVEELAWGIDDDGVPEAVHVVATDLVGPAPAHRAAQAA
jgi:hypothetical protein